MGKIPIDPKSTNLPLPKGLREKVLSYAEKEARTFKGQMIALVLEAIDARERRARK